MRSDRLVSGGRGRFAVCYSTSRPRYVVTLFHQKLCLAPPCRIDPFIFSPIDYIRVCWRSHTVQVALIPTGPQLPAVVRCRDVPQGPEEDVVGRREGSNVLHGRLGVLHAVALRACAPGGPTGSGVIATN